MSQTPVTVTYSLEEVLKGINQKLDRIDEKFEAKLDNLQKDVTDFRTETKVAIEAVKGDINVVKGDIKALDEKVNGISKRLENQEFVSRGVLIALIVAILGGFAKLFGVVGNP